MDRLTERLSFIDLLIWRWSKLGLPLEIEMESESLFPLFREGEDFDVVGEKGLALLESVLLRLVKSLDNRCPFEAAFEPEVPGVSLTLLEASTGDKVGELAPLWILLNDTVLVNGSRVLEELFKFLNSTEAVLEPAGRPGLSRSSNRAVLLLTKDSKEPLSLVRCRNGGC